MDRSAYNKMMCSNFHLLIEILLVFMLNQSANDSLKLSEIVFFTFPGEIICAVGKTGENVQRKRKQSRKLFIYISVK